jgi:hypothetical protein
MNLQDAKKYLPWGFAKELKTRTGFSENMIYAVLNGKRKNLVIVRAIIEMAEAEKKETDQLTERMAAL